MIIDIKLLFFEQVIYNKKIYEKIMNYFKFL